MVAAFWFQKFTLFSFLIRVTAPNDFCVTVIKRNTVFISRGGGFKNQNKKINVLKKIITEVNQYLIETVWTAAKLNSTHNFLDKKAVKLHPKNTLVYFEMIIWSWIRSNEYKQHMNFVDNFKNIENFFFK